MAWLLFEKFCAHNEPDSPGLHLVQVQPVRGYTKTAARLSTLLAQQGFAPLDEEIIPLLLKASGLVPGSYSAELRHRVETRHALRHGRQHHFAPFTASDETQ
ncbi:MAG: hypothetical protein M5U34_17145 [Chloroflexi bacterium]|nr:hypothetical protein [Chloroflexota bacterium]